MHEDPVTRRDFARFAVGTVGAAAAVPALITSSASPAGALAVLPWFNVLDYGAVGNGVADETAAIQAAINAAAAAMTGTVATGGVVIVPPGRYKISGPITLNASKPVHLVGMGMSRTRFVCANADAGLRFGDLGGLNGANAGRNGGFWIDGNGVATTALNVGVASNTAFVDIGISGCPSGTGLLIERTQNSVFENFRIGSCATGVALDFGAGGNVFSMVELDANGTNLVFRNSWDGNASTRPDMFDGVPSNNKFICCSIERSTSLQVDHATGNNNAFFGCGFAGGGVKFRHRHAVPPPPPPAPPLPPTHQRSGGLSLVNCTFLGATGTGLEHTAIYTSVALIDCTFRTLDTAVVCNDGCYVDDSGCSYVNALSRFNNPSGTQTEDVLVAHENRHHYQVTAPTGTSRAFRTVVTTAESKRDGKSTFELKASGEMGWGSGAANPDVTLGRAASGILQASGKLTAVGGIGVGNSAAASTLGTVIRKIQVFDKDGNSLGYVPVYGTIS